MITGGNMQRALSNSADGELILKLYELRTEAVMRRARAWITGEFWPVTAAEVFVVMQDADSEKNAWLRQVVSYWEMAAALVLHGSLSSDLFVDCNAEPFFILAKFAPMLAEIHEQSPNWFRKTLQLIENSPLAAAKFEAMQKNVEKRRAALAVQ
jgi:hypothetical protein